MWLTVDSLFMKVYTHKLIELQEPLRKEIGA